MDAAVSHQRDLSARVWVHKKRGAVSRAVSEGVCSVQTLNPLTLNLRHYRVEG